MTVHHPAYKAAQRKANETPAITIKWRADDPPYVEVRENNELILAGWVHPFADAMPQLDQTVDEISAIDHRDYIDDLDGTFS
jgi:hypothetical protein